MLTAVFKPDQILIISVFCFWFVLPSTSVEVCAARPLLFGNDWPQSVAAKVEKQDSSVSRNVVPGRFLLFVEQDQNGNSDTLTKRPYTADINSRIAVQIDKELLARRIEASAGPSEIPVDILEEISALQGASQQGLRGLEPLAAELREWSSTTTHTADQIKKLQSSLSKVANPTVLILRYAKEGSRLRSKINAALESFEGRLTIAEQYRLVFKIAEEEINQLQSEWDSYLRSEGIYVQLGAWLATPQGTGPLHLRGFDAYREGDYLEVERFNLRAAFGEQQKKELERVTAQARQINDEGLVKTVERSALSSIESTFGEALACVDAVAASVDTLRWIQDESLRTIRVVADSAQESLKDYSGYVRGLLNKYKSLSNEKDPAAFLSSTQEDIRNLETKTKVLLARLENLQNDFNGLKNLPQRVQQTVGNAVSTITDCKDHVLGKLSSVARDILDVMGGLFALGGINDGVLDFGNEVLKHDIQNLPDNTELSLTNAGPRSEGDRVTLKIAFGGAKRKSQEMESDEVILLRALSHIDVAVGIIFANREAFTKQKGSFQAAPSYSVLFKFPSRSLSYKRFLDFGIGLNIAAVDFNHDDTPELGVGLVFSAFRDYLQLGLAGYNIYQSRFYWFFGLRLPMPAATLPRASE